MAFCYIAFFGTGNMASLTSFEIQSTYRFTTIFDPFLMGALLVWKVIVPFILVGCAFQTINHRLNIPARYVTIVFGLTCFQRHFFPRRGNERRNEHEFLLLGEGLTCSSVSSSRHIRILEAGRTLE
jgi:hypothetical protein